MATLSLGGAPLLRNNPMPGMYRGAIQNPIVYSGTNNGTNVVLSGTNLMLTFYDFLCVNVRY